MSAPRPHPAKSSSTDPVPLGMTPVSAGGAGWTCAIEAQTVDCRRSDALAPQQAYPALTITVNVGPVALTTTNIATVSGGGDPQPSPSGPDPTTILGRPQLTIIKSHPDPVIQGQRRSAVRSARLEQRHRTDHGHGHRDGHLARWPGPGRRLRIGLELCHRRRDGDLFAGRRPGSGRELSRDSDSGGRRGRCDLHGERSDRQRRRRHDAE